jgi:hypothetical protein
MTDFRIRYIVPAMRHLRSTGIPAIDVHTRVEAPSCEPVQTRTKRAVSNSGGPVSGRVDR